MLVAGGSAKADTIKPPGSDPGMDDQPGSGSIPLTTLQTTFTIAIGANMQGSTTLDNQTGQTIFNILLTVSTLSFITGDQPLPTLSCTNDPPNGLNGNHQFFSDCSHSYINDDTEAQFFFFGAGGGATGIPNDCCFTPEDGESPPDSEVAIGATGFNPGTLTVQLQANIPEPATLTLFASGLGGIVLRRLRRKNRQS
jgi:hypothetical protein